jgi:hypothetical protein
LSVNKIEKDFIIKTNQTIFADFYTRFISTVMVSYKSSFFSTFYLPFGKAEDTPISGACFSKRMPKLAVGGCCEAAAYGIHPQTPWIWGILDFRSIREK